MSKQPTTAENAMELAARIMLTGEPRIKGTGEPTKVEFETGPSSIKSDERTAVIERLAIVLILLVTAAAYIGVIHCKFIYDDFPQIVSNPFLSSWRSIPTFFSASFWTYGWGAAAGKSSPFYRPVFLIWLLMNRGLFRLTPAAWHLAALGVHLGVTILVYFLARKLARKEIAAIAAAIFGVHPIHLEAVAWLSGTADLTAAFWLSLAFLCYLVAQEAGNRRWWMAVSLVSFVLSVLSKETAIVFPLLLFAYEWLFHGRSQWRPRVERAIVPVLPFVVTVILYAVLRYLLFSGFPGHRSELSMKAWLLTIPQVVLLYLRHFFAPTRYSLWYDTYYVTSVAGWEFLLPFAIFTALGAQAIWLSRRWRSPLLLFGVLWALIFTLPALNFRVFFWRDLLHDRYFYLPSIGLSLVVAVVISRIGVRFTESVPIASLRAMLAISAVAALAVVTSTQTVNWSTPLLAYSNAITIAPNNVAANYMLADTLEQRGEVRDALRLFLRVTELAPNWVDGFLAAGRLSMRNQDFNMADHCLSRAIELAAAHPQAYYLLGLVHLQLQRPDAAILLRRALELNPQGAGYHLALGAAFEREHNSKAAKGEYQTELRNHPESEEALRKLQQLDGSR